MRRKRILSWPYLPETALALAGLLCFAWVGHSRWRYREFQAQALATHVSGPLRVDGRRSSSLGVIEIARIGLRAGMVEGSGEESLALGVGHLRESASIGAMGNAVLAGHRDTAFWPLRHLRRGDRIDIRTDRTYRYVVRDMRVVDAREVSLLEPTHDAVLTLVTCYPFRYVGPAPRRFVVRASLVSPATP